MTDFNELLAPLLEERKQLTAKCANLRDSLDLTTKELQQVERVLKAGGLIETTPATKARQRRVSLPLDELTTYLQEHHANGNGFYAAELLDKGFTNHAIYNGLKILADRGVIRLDRMDGMKRVYKLVSS